MDYDPSVNGPRLKVRDFDDCVLGICYRRGRDAGEPPLTVYSADMIVARLRDDLGYSEVVSRCLVVDSLEAIEDSPYLMVWARIPRKNGA